MANANHSPTLASLSIQELTEILCNVIKETIDKVKEIVESGGDLDSIWHDLKHKIQNKKTEITDNLESALLDTVSRRVICYINSILTSGGRNIEHSLLYHLEEDGYIDVCIELMSLAVSSRLHTLDVGTLQSQYLQDALIAGQLEYPNIGILKIAKLEQQVLIQALANRITHLNNLNIFEFHYSCNDYIIETLSKTFPNIEEVNLMMSAGVTDRSVRSLTRLPNLRRLNIYSTSISTAGYARIITNLSKLENIIWDFNEGHLLSEVKTNILQNVVKFVGGIDSSEILVNKCPNIIDLELFRIESDLTPLSELRLLLRLKFCKLNFRLCKAMNVFPSIGQKLNELNLLYVEELDISIIVNFCCVLEDLFICECIFSENEMVMDRTLPHFTNLLNLTLISNVNDKWYRINLKNYHHFSRFTRI